MNDKVVRGSGFDYSIKLTPVAKPFDQLRPASKYHLINLTFYIYYINVESDD